MSLLWILVFALLGLFVGSFLNVCIDRLPRGQSIIHPRSHCASCHRKLANLDVVPVLSYLWLRGRCRYCRAPIPVRLPVVEGVTGLLFALLCWKFGPGLKLGISLVYVSLLSLIFVVDLEHMLVLDRVVYPGIALAFAFSFFWPGLGVISALEGAGIGLGAMALPFIIYRKGWGLGDVKLGALVGLITGYPLVFAALLLAIISGGLVGAVLLALKVKKRRDPIPFAPFLATAAMVTLLWGQAIWQWYLF